MRRGPPARTTHAVLSSQPRPWQLFEVVRGWTAPDRQDLEREATKPSPARVAHVAISWGGVRLLPVLHQQSAHLRPLGVWVGHVWAPQPPEGVERLSWVLWTAVPIRTLEPAWERVDWSGARGIGQDLHQRLK